MSSMQSRAAIWIRVLWMALVLAAAFMLPARAETPLHGSLVRVQAWTIEAGWHQGTVVRAPDGCMQVQLASPDADGHTRIALARVDWLEVRRGESWSTVSVGRLMAKEPQTCRADDAA
jgi:hypothetical protein